MNKENKIKDQIVEILKQKLQQDEDGYNQWVMGVSIKKNRTKGKLIENPNYTVRVVVKTNESIYVDGMDIEFTVVDRKALIDELYYENTPDLIGSPVRDSIKWLLELNQEIYYIQQLNPYEIDNCLDRLKDLINEYFFIDLMEYTLENIIDLYQDLIQEMLLERVDIEGEEISDGKYRLKIMINDTEYTLDVKAWYKKDMIIEDIKENILIPLKERKMKNENKAEIDNRL